MLKITLAELSSVSTRIVYLVSDGYHPVDEYFIKRQDWKCCVFYKNNTEQSFVITTKQKQTRPAALFVRHSASRFI